MTAKDRQLVHDKCNGHCGYCGKPITTKQMQVDHIEPKRRGDNDADLQRYNIARGLDVMANYMPSCARCNRRKGTFTIEQFRAEIGLQIERLNKYNSNYRLAKDYGLITEMDKRILFYFEKLKLEYLHSLLN